jgi:BirA family transcriptional regulator, biotin operon repressor / biotin---[acetyl-CoA-carboxylase] ligase
VTKSLSPSSITRDLRTGFIGRKVIYYSTLPSTMDAARRAARGAAIAGTVIIAGEQTAGKGRLQRTWLSPPGSIALSIVLYPDIASLPYLIMIASLAVSYSIETNAGLKTQIKWPNDILIDGKKVSGILIQNEVNGNRVVFSLVGIGINVDLNISDYSEISSTAASLKSQNGKDIRIKIIRSLLTEFETLYVKLPDSPLVFKAWRARLVTLGKKVRALSGGGAIEGIAENVDETGALLIRQSDYSLIRIVAGDVTLKEK